VTKRTVEERLESLVQRHAKAEASGKAYRAKEAAYRLGGKTDMADKAGKTARDFELNARMREQELRYLQDDMPRQKRVREEEERAAELRAVDAAKVKAQAEQAALDRLRADPLKVYMEALQHAEELDLEVTLYAEKAMAYQRAGDDAKRDRHQRESERRAGWARGWREAAEEAQAQTERDLARERAVALKAKERQDKANAKESARLADLKVESNLETAAGAREYVAGGVRKGRIVSMAAYETLLRRPEDRTKPRLEAMHEFDNLCGTADSGLFPEPKFEHESHGGSGPGSQVMLSRAAGLQELQDLGEAIGPGNVAMLRARIFERQTLSALVRSGHGDKNTAPLLFLAALDSMVVYFKTRNVMAARLAGMGVKPSPAAPKPSGAHNPAERQGRAHRKSATSPAPQS
jgi:hypothetical protein